MTEQERAFLEAAKKANESLRAVIEYVPVSAAFRREYERMGAK